MRVGIRYTYTNDDDTKDKISFKRHQKSQFDENMEKHEGFMYIERVTTSIRISFVCLNKYYGERKNAVDCIVH